MTSNGFSVIGKRLAKPDAVSKVTGRAIYVEYEVLAPVMSIDEALAEPKDERIQDYGGPNNIHKLVALEFGDVAGGFARADHVREDVFFFQGNTHLPMEQHSAVATFVD